MTVALANSIAGNNQGASSITTGTMTVAIDDILVVWIYTEKNTASYQTVSTISDLGGFTWQQRSQVQFTGTSGLLGGTAHMNLECWWAHATGNFTNDTVSIATSIATDHIAYVFARFTGCDTSVPWDPDASLPKTNASVTGGSGNGDSGNFNTTNAHTMAVGALGAASGAGVSDGSGWSAINATSTASGSNFTSLTAEYKSFSAAQTGADATFSHSTEVWIAIGDALTSDASIAPADVAATITIGLTETATVVEQTLAATMALGVTQTGTVAGIDSGRLRARLDGPILVPDFAHTNAIFNAATSYTLSQLTIHTGDILILVYAGESDGPPVLTSVTDAAGLTWKQRAARTFYDGSNHVAFEVWYAIVGGDHVNDTFTIDFNWHCSAGAVGVFRVTGADLTNPFDADASLPALNSDQTANATTAPINTAFPQTCLFSAIVDARIGSLGATPAGWNWLWTDSAFAGATNVELQYKQVNNPQSGFVLNYSNAALPWLTYIDAIRAANVSPFTIEGNQTNGGHGSAGLIGIKTTQPDEIIVLSVANENGTGSYASVTGISDPAGLTWNHLGSAQQIGFDSVKETVEIWWAHAPVPIDEWVTINLSAAVDSWTAAIMGVIGCDTGAPWDGAAITNQSGSATQAQTTISTSAAETLAVSALTWSHTDAASAQSGASLESWAYTDYNTYWSNCFVQANRFGTAQTNTDILPQGSLSPWAMITGALKRDTATVSIVADFDLGAKIDINMAGYLPIRPALQFFIGLLTPGTSIQEINTATWVVTEQPDIVAFSAAVAPIGAMAAIERPDVAAFAGYAHLQGSMAATESVDFVRIRGYVPGYMTLDAVEAPDRFDAIGWSGAADVTCNLHEPPDRFRASVSVNNEPAPPTTGNHRRILIVP